MCTKFFHEKAWICARRTTDRDLESQRHEMVNAWICARPTTHHDLASVFQIRRKREKEKKCFFRTLLFQVIAFVRFVL